MACIESNPSMAKFIDRYPQMKDIAIHRDYIARSHLGKDYAEKRQDYYRVIYTRAFLSNELPDRAAELSGG